MTEVTRMRRLVFQIRFYSNTKDRPQRQQITSIGSPSEVARGGPYIILYHSYIVLISFIHPHVILLHCLSHWQKSTVDQLSGRETLS